MSPKFRTDIQALRGLAVLLVVLHHARVIPLQAGYLGVDIFFVISGYLITGIVRNAILAGKFSFTEFYARRTKRLFPAAYVTFTVTALLSVLLLGQAELVHFGNQLAGALTFSGNMVLWRQTGYFDESADFKPLLHVWSLAIEEQYYLLLPACMVFIPRKLWVPGAVALVLGSLAGCLYLNPTKPGVTFYLLPPRAWELGLGSLGALVFDALRAEGALCRAIGWLYWPAIAALLAIPFAPIGIVHPGPDAIALCLATLIVILRKHPSIGSRAPVKGLAWVGDFSYSLYLVHWPVFAMLRNLWIGAIPPVVNVVSAIAAIGLGYLLYASVERPMRESPFRIDRRAVAGIVAASLLLMAVPFAVSNLRRGPDFRAIKRANLGLSLSCEFKQDFAPIEACRTSDRPKILVWGDSYAMHLVAGIADTSGGAGVVQATRTLCGPALGLAAIGRAANTIQTRAAAESCLRFNQSVLAYLEKADSVETVVLSSPFSHYVAGEDWKVLWKGEVRDANPDLAVAAMRDTVAAVRRMGKRAIVVAAPPAADFDVGACLERKVSGLPSLGPLTSCEIPEDSFHRARARELGVFSRLPGEAGVEVIHLADSMCKAGVCQSLANGTLLYRDGGHLTYEGSKLVARQAGFARRIAGIAAPDVAENK